MKITSRRLVQMHLDQLPAAIMIPHAIERRCVPVDDPAGGYLLTKVRLVSMSCSCGISTNRCRTISLLTGGEFGSFCLNHDINSYV